MVSKHYWDVILNGLGNDQPLVDEDQIDDIYDYFMDSVQMASLPINLL